MGTPKKRPLTPAEALASDEFKKALLRIKVKEGRTQEQVAAMVGVSQGQIWQWANRRLPIPAQKAQSVADAVEEIDPGRLSVEYRDLTKSESIRTPALTINQLENDVDALRHALAALAGVFVSHQPQAAAEVAAAVRAKVPARFHSGGWLADFLDAMDAVARPARRRAASAR